MNRKTTFCLFIAICTVILSACASATPTAVIPNTGNTVVAPPTRNDNGTVAMATNTAGSSESTDRSNLACSGGSQSADPTPELTEGPYFTAGSPETNDLYQNSATGTKVVITGYVYDTDCQPVPNALVDFWQADASGNYDNSGYDFRGHQFTDAEGHYQLTTVVPGLYTGRTEHIHVKVQAPNGKLITTQLFFPDVAQNESDRIFDRSLILEIQESSDGLQGQFNFVVPD